MAYWYRKRGKEVVVYQSRNGKQTQIPRSKTKHLDEQTDEEIDLWVERWSRLNEVYESRPDLKPPSPELDKLFNDYLTYFQSIGKRPNTVEKHRDNLLRVVGFFEGLTLAQWPDKSWHLAQHLREAGHSAETVRRTYQTLGRFWEWAVNAGYVEGVLRKPRLPAPRKAKTPLQRLLTPEDVLAFARSCTATQVKFMALMGYFFSLRPQETFALTPADFAVGKAASGLEACKVMGRAGLYDRLAVWVWRQRARDGIVGPKGEDELDATKGVYVSCFNREAAQLIVEMLNEGFQGVTYQPAYCTRVWERRGIPDTDLKDLRRASIYWLGHETNITESALMNHARHEDFDTTRWYLRRPDNSPPEPKKKFDLDD